ncbi:DUF4350 domain-containing protein [Symbioplanes lichenis]|uniref:DUF4350 domain-containing protein n=1 Tax=Symbioplanes lichenis TaxID=1629072 RepID=UPI00273A12C3|nr:DUF4350 domain-containing protein [Actinoplanes lichenis]
MKRRYRALIPFALVAALVTTTVIAHAVQQPDPTDASFLSPTSDAGDGARRLADGLTRLGVSVDVRTSSRDAVEAVGRAPATIFVTTPGLVNPDTLTELTQLPSRVRVVLVAPDGDQLDDAGLTVGVDGPRWTAAAPAPGCTADFAQAGPAAAARLRYDAAGYSPVSCYTGGVVEFGGLTLVGAADPFRNDRTDEHGNAELALALLARADRLIWLDLHEREKPEPPPPAPTEDEPEPQETIPDDEPAGPDPWDDNGQPAPPGPGEQPAPQAGGEEGAPNPLRDGFPPALWATLALLALAAIALAAASARRLGAPVAEPLPAQVRAAETVRGLGGLYRRARARSTSLGTVQAAARTRLIRHFGLPADTSVDVLAARVAAVTGRPEDEARHVLGGGAEDSDEELARAATEVQHLVRTVTGARQLDEGNVT